MKKGEVKTVYRILGIESQEPREEDELKYIIEIELLRANDTYNINKETNNTKNDTYNVVADAIDGNDVYHETYNINKETNKTKKPIMHIMKATKPRTLRIIWWMTRKMFIMKIWIVLKTASMSTVTLSLLL